MRLFKTLFVSLKKRALASAIKKLLSEQKGALTWELKIKNEAGTEVVSKGGPYYDDGLLYDILYYWEYNPG